MRAAVLILLLAVSLGAQTPPPTLRTETFLLGANTANEAEIYLTHHLSTRGTYRYDERAQAFAVTDEPAYLAGIRAYFASRAQRGPQVRIDILYGENNTYRESGTGVSGGIHGSIGNGTSSNNAHVRINPYDQSQKNTRTVSQFLVVTSGSTAYLDVSKQVPDPYLFLTYAPGSSQPVIGVGYQSAGSRVAVRPVVQENGSIQIEVTPEISFFPDQGPPETVSYRTLSTIVTVPNGGTVPIGGFNQADARFNNNFFVDRSSTRSTANGSFTIRASIVGSSPGSEKDPTTMKRQPLIK